MKENKCKRLMKENNCIYPQPWPNLPIWGNLPRLNSTGQRVTLLRCFNSRYWERQRVKTVYHNYNK